MQSGLMPSDLRKENQKIVLKTFHDNPMLTAVEISARTGISRQTVKKCIEFYLEYGVLCSCGKGDSSKIGGKRPELYSLNDQKRVACIVLHHHEVIISVRNLHYDKIATWRSGTVSIDSLGKVWELVRQGINQEVPEAELQQVIAVALVAPIGYDENRCVQVATPFPKWSVSDYGSSLTEPLKNLFPSAKFTEVFSDGRSAGAALLQENEKLRQVDPLLTLYTSHGIGGGLYKNGVVQLGRHGSLAAMGHVIVDPFDPEPCTCGSHGCLERLVSNTRIRERMLQKQKELQSSCLADRDVDKISILDIFEGSEKGDRFCRAESMHYAEIFSVALHNAALMIAPQTICFQGDYGKADRFFKQELLNRLSEFKYISVRDLPEIYYDTQDLAEQEIKGAAYLLLQDYLENTENYI